MTPLFRSGAASALGTPRGRIIEGVCEEELATVTEVISTVTVKTDGRKRRWHKHKVERRNELVDGTIDAIRSNGRFLSMDEIAAEIGVSKTVLYRYFVDKNDLTTAVMMRFTQTMLIPNMAGALTSDLDGIDSDHFGRQHLFGSDHLLSRRPDAGREDSMDGEAQRRKRPTGNRAAGAASAGSKA